MTTAYASFGYQEFQPSSRVRTTFEKESGDMSPHSKSAH
jgi:hypothetical protein